MSSLWNCRPVIGQSWTWWRHRYKAVSVSSACRHPATTVAIAPTKIRWAHRQAGDDCRTWPDKYGVLCMRSDRRVSAARVHRYVLLQILHTLASVLIRILRSRRRRRIGVVLTHGCWLTCQSIVWSMLCWTVSVSFLIHVVLPVSVSCPIRVVLTSVSQLSDPCCADPYQLSDPSCADPYHLSDPCCADPYQSAVALTHIHQLSDPCCADPYQSAVVLTHICQLSDPCCAGPNLSVVWSMLCWPVPVSCLIHVVLTHISCLIHVVLTGISQLLCWPIPVSCQIHVVLTHICQLSDPCCAGPYLSVVWSMLCWPVSVSCLIHVVLIWTFFILISLCPKPDPIVVHCSFSFNFISPPPPLLFSPKVTYVMEQSTRFIPVIWWSVFLMWYDLWSWLVL